MHTYEHLRSVSFSLWTTSILSLQEAYTKITVYNNTIIRHVNVNICKHSNFAGKLRVHCLWLVKQ
jgi:hypothetical protein